MHVDFFIFDRSPKTFRKDIVSYPTFAIDTDLDMRIAQQVLVLWTGKMTSLVTLPDHWDRRRKGTLSRGFDKRHVERMIQFPTDHITRIPI